MQKRARHGFRLRGNRVVIKEYSSKNSYQRESKALLSLQPHPFVTELIKSYDYRAFNKFVGVNELRYYKGCDLHAWCHAHPEGSDIKFVRYVMKKVLLAYDYAAKKSIYHRDIKPENVMIDQTGMVKLIDWELCSFTKYSDKKVGTYQYMAEEVLRGKLYECEKSDIWSLGILFFALSTGKRPYERLTSNRTYEIYRHNSDEWLNAIYSSRWIRFWKSHENQCDFPHLSVYLKSCIEGMMQKEPDDRFKIETVMCHDFFCGDEYELLEVVEEMHLSITSYPFE